MKSELEQGFQGAANAGRPLLLEGGLDWKAMSLSPRDMDFIEARHAAAREIALALGVPPKVHFWSTGEWREQDLYPVADTFDEFLSLLRPDIPTH